MGKSRAFVKKGQVRSDVMAQPSQLEYTVEHSDTKIIFVSEEQQEKLEAVVKKVPREIQVIPIDVDSESSTPEFSQCLLC